MRKKRHICFFSLYNTAPWEQQKIYAFSLSELFYERAEKEREKHMCFFFLMETYCERKNMYVVSTGGRFKSLSLQ